MNRRRTNYLTFSECGNRKENEDFFSIYTMENEDAGKMNRGEMFVVADGMGGHSSGSKAARQTCERLFETYYSPDFEFVFDDPDAVEEVLKRVFSDINSYLTDMGKDDPELFGWGCTASALILGDQKFYFAHTGDTRIFRIQKGKSELLTEDQNVAYQMLKYKQISYEEYLNGLGHNKLLSYIGVGEGISIKTGRGERADDDIFLICSDGFNDFCQIHTLEKIAGCMNWNSTHGKMDIMNSLYKTFIEDHFKMDQAKDNITFILIG